MSFRLAMLLTMAHILALPAVAGRSRYDWAEHYHARWIEALDKPLVVPAAKDGQHTEMEEWQNRRKQEIESFLKHLQAEVRAGLSLVLNDEPVAWEANGEIEGYEWIYFGSFECLIPSGSLTNSQWGGGSIWAPRFALEYPDGTALTLERGRVARSYINMLDNMQRDIAWSDPTPVVLKALRNEAAPVLRFKGSCDLFRWVYSTDIVAALHRASGARLYELEMMLAAKRSIVPESAVEVKPLTTQHHNGYLYAAEGDTIISELCIGSDSVRISVSGPSAKEICRIITTSLRPHDSGTPFEDMLGQAEKHMKNGAMINAAAYMTAARQYPLPDAMRQRVDECGRKIIAHIESDLQSSEPQKLIRAVTIIGNIGGEYAINRLLELDWDRISDYAFLYPAYYMGPRDLMDHRLFLLGWLRQGLNSPDAAASVQEEVLPALVGWPWMADSPEIEALVEMARELHDEGQKRIVYHLARTDVAPEAVVDYYLHAVRSENLELNRAAWEALDRLPEDFKERNPAVDDAIRVYDPFR